MGEYIRRPTEIAALRNRAAARALKGLPAGRRRQVLEGVEDLSETIKFEGAHRGEIISVGSRTAFEIYSRVAMALMISENPDLMPFWRESFDSTG